MTFTYRCLLVLLLLAASGIPASVALASGNISDATALFLVIPVDIRSRAMGDIGVALPGGGFALDHNPAQLLENEYAGVGTGGGAWLPALADDWRLSGRYVTISARGLGFPLALGVARKTLDADGVYWMHGQATIYGLSVSPDPHLYIGYAAKEIRSDEYWHEPVRVWAHDLGVFATGLFPMATQSSPIVLPDPPILPYANQWQRTYRAGFSLGLSIRNMGDSVFYPGLFIDTYPLPRTAVLGASYRAINDQWLSVLLSAEIARPLLDEASYPDEILNATGQLMLDALTLNSREGDIWGWGGEISVLQLIDLRFGRHIDPQGEVRTWTYGFGLGISRLQLNYARTAGHEALGGTDMWSVELRW